MTTPNIQSTSTDKLKLRVLIIEDDLSLEPVWNYILGQLNFEIEFEWVYSFAEAERSIKNVTKNNSQYDLVLLDVFIYGSKSGIDFWAQYHETMNERLVVMSSIEQCKIKGYLHAKNEPFYIQKPIDISKTIAFLNGHLNNLTPNQNRSSSANPLAV